MLELVYKIPSMCILLTVSPQVDPEKNTENMTSMSSTVLHLMLVCILCVVLIKLVFYY